MSSSQKIAVAMSGGVDSSVAAYLFTRCHPKMRAKDPVRTGEFEVIGVNLDLWTCFKSESVRNCCSPSDRLDARRVCKALNIPFVSIDLRERFKKDIVGPFVKEYSMGRTPNPCIHCNTRIKFGAMLEWVKRELGATKIATGHYAQIKDSMHLLRGLDAEKDQSYFLFDIPKERLGNIIFPLGGMTKQEVRKIAAEANLPVAEKSESQEVCFVPDGDIGAFIESFYPEKAGGPGNFVDGEGNAIGRHCGTHAFTIGQRRGLGTGFGKRKYVKEIRPGAREVVLADDDELFSDRCIVRDVTMLEDIGETFSADVKIRYKTPPVKALIKPNKPPRFDGTVMVEFSAPVRAITPGQAAVFYDGDVVLGGGWIV